MIPATRWIEAPVEVRDLFFATPARLKFLKAARTEVSHAQDTVNRLAMAHPHVGFTLSDGERKMMIETIQCAPPGDWMKTFGQVAFAPIRSRRGQAIEASCAAPAWSVSCGSPSPPC